MFQTLQTSFVLKFSILKIVGSMAWKLVRTKLRRYAFVWRYDTTNRKPHAKKTIEKYSWTKRIHDFENFEVEQTDCPKTILATNSPNHPGDGITLRQNRSSSHIIICKASAARQWNSRQRRKFIENYSFRCHQRQYFIKFSIFEISVSMTPKLGLTKLRRYAFVWRYDTTNRKPHAKKQLEKYGWTKRIHRFREIRTWTTRSLQNDFSHELAQPPR